MDSKLVAFSPEVGDARILPNRLRLAALTVAAIALAAACAAMATHSAGAFNRLVGWFGVAFFGLGAPVIAWRAASDRGVHLTRDGFEIRWARRRVLRMWRDVSDFQVVRIGQFNRFVGFNLTSKAHDIGPVRIGHAMSGVDSLLPSNLQLRPEELASVMNAWRERYAGQNAGAAERS